MGKNAQVHRYGNGWLSFSTRMNPHNSGNTHTYADPHADGQRESDCAERKSGLEKQVENEHLTSTNVCEFDFEREFTNSIV